MGSLGDTLKDTLAKMATGVTTTVASGVILTFVTTYVLVDLKKDRDKAAAAADSAKTIMQVAPAQNSVQLGRTGIPSDRGSVVTTPSVLEKPLAGGSPGTTLPAGNAGTVTNETKAAMPAGGTSAPGAGVDKSIEKKAADVRALADSAMKELDQVAQGKEKKPEEVGKPKPTEIKPKQVELKKDVKDVHQRADDVFDELDKEVEPTPAE